jgi:hypothetical protein
MHECGLLKSRSDKPYLIEVTPEGWQLIAELSTHWSEEELTQYFLFELAGDALAPINRKLSSMAVVTVGGLIAVSLIVVCVRWTRKR